MTEQETLTAMMWVLGSCSAVSGIIAAIGSFLGTRPERILTVYSGANHLALLAILLGILRLSL